MVRDAYRDPLYGAERRYTVYAARKMMSEEEAWKFMIETKPGFIPNAVLPNINFGANLDLASQVHFSTSGLVFNSNRQPLAGLPAPTSDIPTSPTSPYPVFNASYLMRI
ncbi:hypothetical protein HD806DRAFT_515193, partial [Xylariaceae sp. AK1471]